MRRSFVPWLLLGALAFCGWLGAERVRTQAWVTADEPDHVAACRELRSGPGVVSNFEHPVFAKLLGAAGLPKAPAGTFVEETRSARRLFPLVFALLVAAAGTWTLLRSGPAAGLAVAALLALEPTLRGHAPLVHTDLLLTAFLCAAAAALDLSGPPRAPRPLLLVLSGAFYGLALASKYSALPFLGVFLFAAVLRLRGFPGRGAAGTAGSRASAASASAAPASRAKRRAAGARASSGPLPPVPWRVAALRALLLVGLPALLVASLIQQATVALTTSRAELRAGVERKFGGFPYEAEALRAAATFPRGAAAYVAGLSWVRASAEPGVRVNYFRGEVSGTGFFLYFPAALALKLTTGSVLLVLGAAALAIAALAGAVRRGRPGGSAGRRRLLRLLAARSGLPALLGAAYMGAAMISNVNIGVRHVLPSVPLLFVAAAGALRTLAPGSRILRGTLLGAVVVASAVEAGSYLGREIPFGNVLAGGPPGVRRFLSDSNVDWGEAQGRLFERVSKGTLGRTGVVSFFYDGDGARRVGVPQVDELSGGAFDTVAVSVHVEDLCRAIEKSPVRDGKIEWLRGWMVPLLRDARAGAVSVEPFGDEYVLYRMTARPRGGAGLREDPPSVPTR